MTDQLIKRIERDCPICNRIHPVEMRKRATQALLKNETIDYFEAYFLCPESGEEENEFVPAKVMDENLLRVRDAYRKSHGLLTSEEIAKIRGGYGLTQSEFAALLGWGEVTVTRYESKTIQDETYDSLMRMVSENPMLALEYLNRHKERFSLKRYEIIRQTIVEKLEEEGGQYLRVQEIKSLYVRYEAPSDFNGYKVLDIHKLSSVMSYFAQYSKNLYKVKLMKLLWYADVLFFKRHGRSMTGLVYEHMTYGALPIGFNEIIELPAVKVVEEFIYEDISYRILPAAKIDNSQFALEELRVLQTVAEKFKDFKTKQIVEYMHQEKAYLETDDRQIIPYSLAKELKELD